MFDIGCLCVVFLGDAGSFILVRGVFYSWSFILASYGIYERYFLFFVFGAVGSCG